MKWNLIIGKSALIQSDKVKSAGLEKKVNALLDIIEKDPFTNPPSFKALTGDAKGSYSRRINLKHRLVYDVDLTRHTVTVTRMFGHY